MPMMKPTYCMFYAIKIELIKIFERILDDQNAETRRVQTAKQNQIFSPSKVNPDGFSIFYSLNNHIKYEFCKKQIQTQSGSDFKWHASECEQLQLLDVCDICLHNARPSAPLESAIGDAPL